ncbi:MAG: hypothetical protein RRZ84_02830 [Romboutsia sp.]
MAQCKTCGKTDSYCFNNSDCKTCQTRKLVIKDGKEIYEHITILMKECNISFEQSLEIIKLVNLHEVSEGLDYLTKAVYAIGE